MKKIYTLLATFVAVFVMSASANAQSSVVQDSSQVKVIWNSVNIDRGATSNVTVRASIALSAGVQSFTGTIFPDIHSINFPIDFGYGEPKQVTLSRADGNKETDILTWNFTSLSIWGKDGEQDKSGQVHCVMYSGTTPQNGVALASVEVNRSGTTGVSDIVAEDNAVKEVYSLGGVRVAAGDDVDMQSLAPGMYIVRQGSKYTKVMRR